MRRHLPALIGLPLLLAACGTQDAGPADPAGAASTDTASTGATVDVADFAFGPETIEVTAGSTVTWTNRDRFAHTVTSGPPNAPDGGFDEPLGDPSAHEGEDATATVTFDEPGTYPYFCDLHPSMVGEVVVTSP